MKKNPYKVPKNTVRIITNVNDQYEIADYDLKELASSETPMIAIPVTDEMIPDCPHQIVENGIPESILTKALNSMPIDPFIPYAMTTEPGERFMERTELGIATIGNKRFVTECSYVDDVVRPLTVPAIIGDKLGPVGMFIPFNASKEAIEECAELFTDLYNGYEDRNSFTATMIDRAHDPKYKKLPF